MRGRSKQLWWGTALEAPDPAALATFYSGLLDWPVVHQEPGTTVIKPPQDLLPVPGPRLSTAAVPLGGGTETIARVSRPVPAAGG